MTNQTDRETEGAEGDRRGPKEGVGGWFKGRIKSANKRGLQSCTMMGVCLTGGNESAYSVGEVYFHDNSLSRQ